MPFFAAALAEQNMAAKIQNILLFWCLYKKYKS